MNEAGKDISLKQNPLNVEELTDDKASKEDKDFWDWFMKE